MNHAGMSVPSEICNDSNNNPHIKQSHVKVNWKWVMLWKGAKYLSTLYVSFDAQTKEVILVTHLTDDKTVKNETY